MNHVPDHSGTALNLVLRGEDDTLALGASLAEILTPGLQIHLTGELGAGKTTLVRGLVRALGYGGPVKSPTFTLVELYAISSLDLYHFDFYRFSQPEEFFDAGLEEYFAGNAVCLVEWPDKSMPYLPPADLVVALRVAGEARRADIRGESARGRACLGALRLAPWRDAAAPSSNGGDS